jgi:hydrogenase expression/formation protein HypD
MKYVDEFRDPRLIRQAAEEIRRLADPDRHYRIMEVCGGHTHAIYRFGLEGLLPENVELIHGPGCPVCVLPMGRTDDGLALAALPDVIFTAFGDVMRVPGTHGSPLEHKARGAEIRMVYSPLDALKLAQANPGKHVVFFAIGFETTAPSTALTVLRARQLGVPNFSVFCNHVTIVPAIRAILDSPDMRLDAFIGPGHVSTVIGCRPYEFIAKDFGKPVVVSGFEPLDILQSLVLILRQLREGRSEVENQYARVVPWEGNVPALRALAQVFELRPYFEWRGLGFISQSALKLRDELAGWDSERRFTVPGIRVTDPKAAQCGEVLKGVLKPHQCKLFGRECTPELPVGALMVSSEGACAAYFNYVRRMHLPTPGPAELLADGAA